MESKQWNPGHWCENKRNKYPKRVWKHCWDQLCAFMGSYRAGLLMAEIRRDKEERESVLEMNRLGIKTIGEVEALELMKKAR